MVLHDLFDDEVFKALGRLPKDYRIVVLLCDIEGFSYKEIADILDIPGGTVMSRIFRGRKMLQKALYDYGKCRGYKVSDDSKSGKLKKITDRATICPN